jgi:hypothetical protein
VPDDDAGRESDTLLAAGVVVRAPDGRPPARGCLTVWVEDVARADARAHTLGRGVTPDAEVGGDPLAFAVRGAAFPPGARPAVRAHLDLDGDGRVSAGDWVTTEHVPAGSDVRLVLHPVG